MDARSGLGDRGEDIAGDYLENGGFQVIARNYRCPGGEIDLVAVKDHTLVFCEVKTRATDRFGSPSEAVDYWKQARLRRLAATWLSEHRPGPVDIRFDVVSVIVRHGRAEVTHIPDAF